MHRLAGYSGGPPDNPGIWAIPGTLASPGTLAILETLAIPGSLAIPGTLAVSPIFPCNLPYLPFPYTLLRNPSSNARFPDVISCKVAKITIKIKFLPP